MTSKFTVNDPRGEYWLYEDGELIVDVGMGGAGGCNVNTSDVHIVAGGPIDADKAAEILVELLAFMGGKKGGFSKLILHNDGVYQLTDEHFSRADMHLEPLGFKRSNFSPTKAEWEKS